MQTLLQRAAVVLVRFNPSRSSMTRASRCTTSCELPGINKPDHLPGQGLAQFFCRVNFLLAFSYCLMYQTSLRYLQSSVCDGEVSE